MQGAGIPDNNSWYGTSNPYGKALTQFVFLLRDDPNANADIYVLAAAAADYGNLWYQDQ